MIITWLGNSSFLIKTSLGKKILMDPFDTLNTFNTDINVDIITFSKNTYANIKAKDFTKVISSADNYSDKDISIKGYLTYSDSYSGLKRGENIIYLYEIDGLKLCHLGYLGCLINNELINIFKNCDILFIPIGGHTCLDGNTAQKLCDLLNPKFIFPMCYKNSNSNFYFNGPKDFLLSQKNILLMENNSINTSDLPKDSNKLIIMPNMYI